MTVASAKQAHLEMIQGVINRLSHNSFLLKGWSVILVAGMFALGTSNSNSAFFYLAYFPALAFWGLDGYFLRQERLFRALYDKVRALDDDKIDYSMDTSVASEFVRSWMAVSHSTTLLVFHGAVILSILVVMRTVIRS